MQTFCTDKTTYILERIRGVNVGVNNPLLPHSEDNVESSLDVGTLPFQVQQVTKIEGADTLIVLVHFQRANFLASAPLETDIKDRFNQQKPPQQKILLTQCVLPKDL